MGSMGFVVLENSLHYFTRVHRADCSRAKPPGTMNKTTRWHPLDGTTYASFQAARAAALGLRQRENWRCAYCLRLDREWGESPALREF